MDDFNSETDSDYTSYWRDWVSFMSFLSACFCESNRERKSDRLCPYNLADPMRLGTNSTVDKRVDFDLEIARPDIHYFVDKGLVWLAITRPSQVPITSQL